MIASTRRVFAYFAVSCLASAASAQAVDYAALQEVMGEPVTTSVTGKPQRASETPAAIEIITRDQIEHSPAHDVPGLLKTYAGIDLNRWTAGHSDVAVRGGVQTYNPRLLVLVNGRQVYLDHYGMTDWSLLGVQLEEIQQIELVRGPASALFGFNAASAVVNIITMGASSDGKMILAGELGTHGYGRLSASAILPLGSTTGLRLSAGHQREHERDFDPRLQAPASLQPAVRDEVKASLESTLGSRSRIAAKIGYSDNRQLELLPTQVATRQHFQAVTAAVRVDRDTDWGSLTARAYSNWLDAHYGAGDSGTIGLDVGSLKNRITVGAFSGLVRLGLANTLRFSAEYRNNRLDGQSLFSPRIDYTVWSGSGMIDLHPTERIAVTLAGRLDRLSLSADGPPRMPAADPAEAFDRNFVRPSFNAALLYQVGAAGQLRVNGGLGYQVPSLVSFGLRLPIGPFPGLPLVLLAGSPALNPTSVWSGEVGYSQPLSSTTKGSVSIFLTRTRHPVASPGDMPALAPTTIGGLALVTRFQADGDYRTLGTEVSLDGKVGTHVTWRANYSFVDVDEHLVPLQTLAFAPAATTARHKANAEIGYHRGAWFATGVLRYTSATRQLANDRNGHIILFPVHDALAWDQKVGVKVGPTTFYVSGENITGASGAAGSPIPADRRFIIGAKLAL